MAKKKNKKPTIIIKDVSKLSQIKEIQAILDAYYNGVMPKEIYDKFMNVISRSRIKSFFSQYFKPNTLSQSQELKPVNKKKKIVLRRNLNNSSQDIITVFPTEFSFINSLEGPKLVYKDHKTFFMGDKNWFNSEILSSINRTFKITISLYRGFNFVPTTDKQVFEELLKEKYSELKAQADKEDLEDCFSIVEEFLIEREKDFVNSFRQIKIKTYLKNYKFLKRKQVYEYKFNVLEYLQLPQTIRITIPLSSIIKHVQEEGFERFNNIVSEKWKNGYVKTFDIAQVFPNLSKTETNIIIPKIFIDRLGNDKPIEIKVIYSEIEGKFNSKLASYIRGYNYYTETSGVVFNENIKTSIRNILRKIDDRFLITFYTSYNRMFNEGDNIIQSVYEKQFAQSQSEAFKEYEEGYTYRVWSQYDRFVSGYSELQYFDKKNNKDWMWLTEQLKNGEIKEAFVFRDSDQTYSSKVGDTVKYPVKVYLTISEDRYKRTLVSLYALDTEKSIYRFSVEKEKKYEAIFFVWSYFSSNNYNKRQDFLYIHHHFRGFGINYFYKDSPLEYRYGIGYCERGWLDENH